MIIDYRSWAKKVAKNWTGVGSLAITSGRQRFRGTWQLKGKWAERARARKQQRGADVLGE